ncbi:hypothetical protein MmiHf6_14660 [Methanimicrococcus hongohii]|uniref:Uncharacterized protein n=1 Tax=Methanimicrococcus hongohii TaxID=3028295 RepID=A0AA96VC19_9EURY|nr:hypothetical protein [Methanimicrococcus sp. Hf6]WNY24137.1 hypothetical protein MmiHf6_14660 [Methanimicrococcus sp. Hf6]
MRYETLSEIISDVRKAPESTPEEIEETKKMLERADQDWERQMYMIKMGLNPDGTKYKSEERDLEK